MVALDLFAALMAADLPNRSAIVLAEVLLQTYGPRKPKRGVKAIHLDPAQIEHYTGLHRNNARKAVHELVAANILLPQDDGAYKFNKDYESWTPGGEPLAERLGGGLIRFAASALSRHGISNESASTPIQRDCPSTDDAIQRDSHEAGHVNPTGLGSGGACESNGIGPTVDVTGGNIGSAGACAPEDLEIREERTKTPPNPPSGGRVGGRDSASPDSGKTDPAKAEANRIADAVIRGVFEMVDSAGNPDPDAAGMLACWIIGASERAVTAAARHAKLKAKRDPLRFLVGMCQNGLEEPPAGAVIPNALTNGKPAPKRLPDEEIERMQAEEIARRRRTRRHNP